MELIGLLITVIFIIILVILILSYLYRCKHQYKIIHKENLISKTSYNSSSYENTGIMYIQRCEKCGKIKSTKI